MGNPQVARADQRGVTSGSFTSGINQMPVRAGELQQLD